MRRILYYSLLSLLCLLSLRQTALCQDIFHDLLSVRSTANFQGSNIQFSNTRYNSFTVTWSKGSGFNTLVLIKSGSAVSSSPTDGNSYTSSAIFGSGSQIGTGNYVVYNGTGSSVSVTGLTPDIVYHVAVFSFSILDYNTDLFADNTGNKRTLLTAYQDVIDYAVANSITLPPQDILDSDNARVVASIADGTWTGIDCLWMTANRGSYRAYAKINWADPGNHNLEEVGTLTFDDTGFTGDGSTGYLRTHYIPSTDAVNYTLNSASILLQLGRDRNVSEVAIGVSSTGSTKRVIVIPKSSGNGSYIINGVTSDTYTVTDATGFWHWKRTNSNAVAVSRNGTLVDTQNVASTAVPDREIYILATNSVGTAASFSQNTIKFAALGSSQSGNEAALYADWEAAPDQSLGFTPGTVYYLRESGQSNMEGINTVASLSAPLKRRFNNVYIWYNPSETSTGGRWEKLQAGVNNERASRLQYYGSEIAIADAFETNHPTDVLYISKYAQGSTAMDASGWAANSGLAFAKARDCYHNPSYAAVDALYVPAIVDLGMVWMQGESDATVSATSTSGYTTSVVNMLSAFRTSLSKPTMSAVVCRLNSVTASPRVRGAEVRAAQSTSASRICDPALYPLNLFFDTDAYSTIDGTHFEQIPFGEDLYDLLF